MAIELNCVKSFSYTTAVYSWSDCLELGCTGEAQCNPMDLSETVGVCDVASSAKSTLDTILFFFIELEVK